MDTARRLRIPGISRRSSAVAISLLLVLVCLIGACNAYAALDLKRGPNDYNLADWELRHLPERWLFLLGQALHGAPSNEEQDQTLRRFLALTPQIEDLERRISDAEQRGQTPSQTDQDQLKALLRERDDIESQAEATIESRLSDAASDLGLTRTPLDIVWPPIDTEFTQSPYTLVTSPRDRIELRSSSLLREDLTLAEVEAIEDKAEAGGDVSALAFPTGGIGAYPTIVDYPRDYRDALGLVGHEWTHNYLVFRPLGLNYYTSNDLRTINETVADLVGTELADAAAERWPLDVQEPSNTPAPSAPSGTRFDIGDALRSLRLEVDALLAQGKIDKAEALMEQRRQEFAAKGYYFRRLNQAYFAFTNLYAGQAGDPSATNPIGPKVDELRRRSASLSDFLNRVGGVTSVADLDRLLAQ